jgi:UDP-N-acetyl-D-mannosaminuronate dehydrogenase
MPGRATAAADAKGERQMNERIAVMGAGVMGAGIVQVMAIAGHDVVGYDVNADVLTKAREEVATGRFGVRSSGASSPPSRPTSR